MTPVTRRHLALSGRHASSRRAEQAALLIFALFVLSSCRTQPPPDTEPDATPPVTSEAERGPVHLLVSASPGAVRVGDPITLSIEVVTEPDVDIEMPTFEDSVGPFEIDDARLPPDVPEGARRRWSHTYTLSTFDDGQLDIPEIAIDFTDRRDAENPIEGEIAVAPLRVEVRSVLAGAEPDPGAIHDIKGAVEVPVKRGLPEWIPVVITVFAVAAFLLVAMWLIRRRARAEAEAAYVPAHVWAMLQLDRLADDDLVARKEVHAFYYRLSDIVRRYIERRYGLRAPEQTTEEFLREMQRSRFLTVGHKELLAGFLRAADMVKFALHEPEPDDCQEAFDSASRFVKETTPDEEEQENLKVAELQQAREAAA